MRQVWMAALDPITGGQRPLGTPGSGGWATDYFSLFDPANDANWPGVLEHLSVLKVYVPFIANATDSQLRSLAAWLERHDVQLALEAGVLPVSNDPNSVGYGVEGYNAGFFSQIARMGRLGLPLTYLAMDEPFYFGTQYSGPNAANASVSEIAREVAASIKRVRTIYPDLKVGDIEPVPYTKDLDKWFEAYAQEMGEPLDFFHVDAVWTSDYATALETLVPLIRSWNMQYGVIYNGTSSNTTDAVWAAEAANNYRSIEANSAFRPETVVFQSWMPNPSRLFPQTMPGTLTNLMAGYLAEEAAGAFGPTPPRLLPDASGTEVAAEITFGRLIAEQGRTDHSSISPFNALRWRVRTAQAVTATVSYDPAAGSMDFAGGAPAGANLAPGSITITGQTNSIRSALKRLMFHPAPSARQPGTIDQVLIGLKVSSGGTTFFDNVNAVSLRVLGDPVEISGTRVRQPTTSGETPRPFAEVVLKTRGSAALITAKVTYPSADGTLSPTSDSGCQITATPGALTIAGTAALVQAALRSLEFVPTTQEAADRNGATRFTLEASAQVVAPGQTPAGGSPSEAPSPNNLAQAFSAFSPQSNAVQGYSITLGGPVTPFQERATVAGVLQQAYSSFIDPSLGIYTYMPDGTLSVHPGPEQYAVLRWSVAKDDVYNLNVTFGAIGPATTDVHVIVNGKSIFDGLIGFGSSQAIISKRMTLGYGSSIDIVVGNGGNGHDYDTTSIVGSIIAEGVASTGGVAMTVDSATLLLAAGRNTSAVAASPASLGIQPPLGSVLQDMEASLPEGTPVLSAQSTPTATSSEVLDEAVPNKGRGQAPEVLADAPTADLPDSYQASSHDDPSAPAWLKETGGVAHDPRIAVAGDTSRGTLSIAVSYAQARITHDGLGATSVEHGGRSETALNLSKISFLDGRLVFDPNAHAAVVSRLYKAGLDRNPDQGGLKYWTGRLQGGAQAADVAGALIGSTEFVGHFGREAPAGQFVEQLYRSMFGREADADGLSFWAGRLSGTASSQADVLSAIADSKEARLHAAKQLQQGIFVEGGAEQQVTKLYAIVLGRLPDALGLQHWTGTLDETRSVAAVAEALAASNEFRQSLATVGSLALVERVSQSLLDYQPDPDSLARLSAAFDRGELAAAAGSISEIAAAWAAASPGA